MSGEPAQHLDKSTIVSNPRGVGERKKVGSRYVKLLIESQLAYLTEFIGSHRKLRQSDDR